jgi:hypothetical protein
MSLVRCRSASTTSGASSRPICSFGYRASTSLRGRDIVRIERLELVGLCPANTRSALLRPSVLVPREVRRRGGARRNKDAPDLQGPAATKKPIGCRGRFRSTPFQRVPGAEPAVSFTKCNPISHRDSSHAVSVRAGLPRALSLKPTSVLRPDSLAECCRDSGGRVDFRALSDRSGRVARAMRSELVQDYLDVALQDRRDPESPSAPGRPANAAARLAYSFLCLVGDNDSCLSHRAPTQRASFASP